MSHRAPWCVALAYPILSLVCFGHFAAASAAAAGASFEDIRTRAANIQSEIVAWRRELHKWPELNYQEHKTSEFVKNTLREMGLNFTSGWGINTRQDRIPGPGGTGVVVELGTGEPPIVALRADFDGLPIKEKTPVAFKSEHEGRMHACGHDGHTSMLLGAAKLLKDLQPVLPGTVRLIFQPAEEGGAGAARMVEEGVLKGVSRIFGFHLWPSLPSGTVGGRPGTIMGGEEDFELRIVGRGAHGAMPHQGIDPIVAASAVVQSLQSLVSRETDPLESSVVSVTIFQAGNALNAIPEEVKLGGTLRAVSVSALEMLRKRFVDVVTAVASAHRCSVESLEFSPDLYPPVINDPPLFEWLQSAEAGIVGTDDMPFRNDLQPTFASEDFSFFSTQVPAAFLFLGIGSGSDGNAPGFPTNTALHNAGYNMDESVLSLGAALHTQLALRSLGALQILPQTTNSTAKMEL